MNEDIEKILKREQISLADIQKRAVAAFIDELLLSVLLIIALYDAFAAATTMEEMIALSNTFLLEFLLIKVLYHTFFLYQYGASIGKLLMKIYVIELDTLSKPTVMAALNRAIVRVISELFLYLGFVWALLDPYRQSWQDKSAKTIVVDV